jgi:hypothetical protein
MARNKEWQKVSVKTSSNFRFIFPCAHPELVEGSERLILQQVQDEREK